MKWIEFREIKAIEFIFLLLDCNSKGLETLLIMRNSIKRLTIILDVTNKNQSMI